MKQLIELRDKMRAKNYLENAKIINAAIERIEELELINDAFYRKGYSIATIGSWFAVGKKNTPTCEDDADGYNLNLIAAIKEANEQKNG